MIKLASALMIAGGLVAAHSADHWTATLRSADTQGVTGTAQFEASGPSSVKVSIAIDNAPAGSILHWRLSSGTCTDGGGAVVGSEKDYKPLRTPEGATKAELKTTLPIMPDSGSMYVVQVLGPVPAPSLKEDPRMAAQKTHVMACGELQPAGMTPSN